MDHLAFRLETKALDDSGAFEGYGAVFAVKDLGGDIIEPGAFRKTLAARGAKGVKMLADHDPTKRIGVWNEMTEDGNGLYVKGRLLVEKQAGREAYIDLKAGALDGLSIGYRTVDSTTDNRRRARILKEIDLFEVSLVTFPMQPAATVTAVKAAERIQTIREFEDFLRDEGGFSHAAAKAIALRGFKASDPRDEDGPDVAALLRRNIEALAAR